MSGHRQHRGYSSGGYSSGGYGRGRGGGGRGRYYDDGARPDYDQNRDRDDFQGQGYQERGYPNRGRGGRGRGGGGRGGGERPPPGLRGKEIGMWYARKGRAAKEVREKQERPVVHVNHREQEKIRAVLNDLDDEPAGQGHHIAELNPQATSYGSDWSDVDVQKMSASNISSSSGMETGSDSTHIRFEDENDSEEEMEVSGFKDYLEVSKFESEDYIDLTKYDEGDSFQPDDDYRSTKLDQIYRQDLDEKRNNEKYLAMLNFRKKLPAYKMKDEIIETISTSQVVVISGETGCGKTTQVPQFILDNAITQGRGSQCHVICTQPRRISAISVAQRVAQERAVKCGDNDEVGFMIRLEKKMPRPRGSMLFCTTGCVLKFLESDPMLTRATHIVIDEIHERDLQSDFLMIILKDILPLRPDLKIVLMSATLNAELFSQYFNGSPMLHIPGFTYPVEEVYLEDVMEMIKYQAEDKPSYFKPKRFRRRGQEAEDEYQREIEREEWRQTLRGKYSNRTISSLKLVDDKKVDLDLIYELICHICKNKPDGAILVFVPGWSEISTLNKLLTNDGNFTHGGFRIIPLHSLMPTANQQEVFDRPPPGVRKIVIATNIAETSITIDDIVYVIDAGKIKLKDFEHEKNLSTLESKQTAKANAKQRRGRAGRVQPGICYRLYTSEESSHMVDFFSPEILRTRLEELCLQIKMLKLGKIIPFISKAMEPPSIAALNHAISTLQDLHALDFNEELLPLGHHLARMPVDPHTGKMILFGAMFGCLDPILTIAASLGFKTAFLTPLGKEKEADQARLELSEDSESDHILLINAMKQWEVARNQGRERQFCHLNFLSSNTLKLLKDMKGQLATLLQEVGFTDSSNPKHHEANIHSNDIKLVKAVICAGLYPNVAMIGKIPKSQHKTFTTVKLNLKHGQRAAMHPSSVNAYSQSFDEKWVIFHKKMRTSDIFVYDCTTISPYPLLLFGGEISLLQDAGDCVSVDGWIIFKAKPDIANLVKDLRVRLDKVLEQKITKPGPTDWSRDSKEGSLMKLIIDLLSQK